MTFVEVLFLAVAMSIDASVVSFSQGLVFTENKQKNSFYLAFWFGLFQALMPVIGWFLARSIYSYVENFAHWISFIIFMLLGIKFIKDAFDNDENDLKATICLSFMCVLGLAVATSIDALAAGATLYFMNIEIIMPAIIIGVVTFFNSLAGFWSGFLFKRFPSRYLEISAGLILIALGVKVLLENA